MEQLQKEKIEKLTAEIHALNSDIDDLSEQITEKCNKIRKNNELIMTDLKEYTEQYYTGKHIQLLDSDVYEIMKITSISDIECMIDEYRMYTKVKVTKLDTNKTSDSEETHMFTVDPYGKLKSFALKILD